MLFFLNHIHDKKRTFVFVLLLMMIFSAIGCSDDVPLRNTAETLETGNREAENILRVVIRWPGDDFASKQDIDTRNRIENLIFEQKVGKIISVGTGMGWMDISVEVKDKQVARSLISEILHTVAPTRKYTIE